MKDVWVIARRELRGYFDHPTAYILVIAFLALGLFLAFRSILAQSIGTMRPLFDLLPWLFAVFVPAMTMRSLAEERRAHTLEWLISQPLDETRLVAGKFLGNWLFVIVALAGTFPASLGVIVASGADPGIVVAQYVGAVLLAAEFVAIGLWASSSTRNQITAFILSAGAAFILILIGLPVVQVGLPPAISQALGRLSVISHFQGIARGVLDLRDLLYFVSTAALFLLFTGAMLLRERLSRSRGAYRRLRQGIATAAALVAVINLLGGSIHGRLDFTRDRLYTLADGTRELLNGLDDIVTVKLFVSPGLPPEVQLPLRDIRDLLADMRGEAGGRLVITEVDPDDDEAAASEASSLGIGPLEFNVLRDDEYEVRRGWLGMAVQFAGEHEIISAASSTDDLEYRLASAISALTAEHKPRLAFIAAGGSRAVYMFPALQGILGERFDVTSVSLDGDSLPDLSTDSIDVVALIGPTQPLSPEASARIDQFIDDGGSALLLLERMQLSQQAPDPQPVDPGLDPLLSERGLRLEPSMVFDAASHANVTTGRQGIFAIVRGYPLWPIAVPAGEHVITRGLENLSLAWAAPITIEDSTHVRALWTTSDQGGTRPVGFPIDPEMFEQAGVGEQLGTLTLAVAVDPGLASSAADSATAQASSAGSGGRMVVVGDTDFLTNQFVQSNPQNLVFAANAIDWLANDESLIRIRAKDRTPPALVFESDFGRSALKWGNLLGVPLLFVILGLVRITGRAGRARKRWESTDTSNAQPADHDKVGNDE